MVKDLTRGSVGRLLLLYSLPLFFSNLFQQVYSIADSVIAGRYAGNDALAAVGASYPITMIFIAVAIGSNIGCGIVISQLFGARDYKKMKTAISTSMLSVAALSVVFTVLGLSLYRQMLALLGTPDNIFADAALYLKIYICGVFFLFFYNICTGIFSALGDSRTPLMFLIISSVGNVILDVVFVKYCHWGVAGVAVATLMAQGASAVAAFFVLLRRLRGIPTEGKYPLFSFSMLKKVSYVSIPGILQQSFMSVGNLFVQNLVNGFGEDVIAGFSAAMKLNNLATTSLLAFGNGVSGFTAQNIGAGERERVRRGYHMGILMAEVLALLLAVLYFVGREPLIIAFLDTSGAGAGIVESGARFLKTVAPFFVVLGIKQVSDGVIKGAGSMKQFMAATLTDLIVRVALSYLLVGKLGYMGIWISWPIGWFVGTGLSVLFYRMGTWKKGLDLN